MVSSRSVSLLFPAGEADAWRSLLCLQHVGAWSGGDGTRAKPRRWHSYRTCRQWQATKSECGARFFAVPMARSCPERNSATRWGITTSHQKRSKHMSPAPATSTVIASQFRPSSAPCRHHDAGAPRKGRRLHCALRNASRVEHDATISLLNAFLEKCHDRYRPPNCHTLRASRSFRSVRRCGTIRNAPQNA